MSALWRCLPYSGVHLERVDCSLGRLWCDCLNYAPEAAESGRIILATDNSTPSLVALDKLGMSPLHQRRQYHKKVLMYKCIHNETEGTDTCLVRHMDRHNNITIPDRNMISFSLNRKHLT